MAVSKSGIRNVQDDTGTPYHIRKQWSNLRTTRIMSKGLRSQFEETLTGHRWDKYDHQQG